MNNYDSMVEDLKNMEKVAVALEVESFSIYFLGGSACILGRYTDRATRDFDFVDLGYSAKLGKVFRYLGDFDMLEYESTILAPTYKTRAKQLTEFKYLQIYVLAKEDIIVSKIIRMESKDIEDIALLIKQSDKNLILQIIEEVLQREDIYPSKREAFIEKLPYFKERYNV
ncbi:DUF6036 family nucleotidyltransferase [Geosporobacter ferrireducens]|uniref:DUF6036 domain-containing protein n=1 Tax=Geosporobacter ferrireducens TaxID=1424294 RepID=A0A1D8GP09_9FIRM|nr:DUF6036 family nucleotidyltransferase [Geosporobacter ferrireducens]AOT72534.1 hypothetical protein Gferi_25055 [Geosporobacter ferrireducens]MTI58168.1 hypothetical protein [Geosporobacter ferrireducens]